MSRKNTGNLSPAASVLLAMVAGLVVAALLMDWMVVDVRATEPDGHATRVWFPLPMAAVRLAAAAVPEGTYHQAELPPEVREHLPAIREVLKELARCPDGPLVQVRSPEEQIDVGLEEGTLRVDVRSPEGTVHVAVPLRRMARALERWDGERVDRDLIRTLLRALDDGFTVSVDSPEARVRVKVR